MREVTYGRVFSFAVKDGRALNEDYLTEHLALALRLDPRPFIRAFSPKVNFPSGEFDVRTQVPLPDRSRLDLVLERAGKPFAWVEIKAGAEEHGDQLRRHDSDKGIGHGKSHPCQNIRHGGRQRDQTKNLPAIGAKALRGADFIPPHGTYTSSG